MNADQPACIACNSTDEQIPLIQIQYRGTTYWICPQHLPVLIHKPAELAHKLPGMENLEPFEH